MLDVQLPNLSMTPKGVEHEVLRFPDGNGTIPNLSMTPKGVEHTAARAVTSMNTRSPNLSMTPKGVEHPLR